MRSVAILFWLTRSTAAFIVPGLGPTAPRHATEGKDTNTLSSVGFHSPIGFRSKVDDTDPEMITDEEDPRDPTEVTDEELEKLLKGLNIGSSAGESRSSSPRGELDEMKLIMALRKRMGEEDFYTVFDPRNPRIGDV